MTVAAAARNGARSAAGFIVLMGVVAMFGDMTYEGARGLVGPYLALLGASATAVGFAAGLGEFLGYGLRLFSGWAGDRTRARQVTGDGSGRGRRTERGRRWRRAAASSASKHRPE